MLDANAGRGRHLAGISPSSMQSKGDFNWRELEALAGGPVLHPTRNLGAVPDLKEAGKMSFGPYLTQGQRQVDNKYILEKALDKTRRDYRDLSQKFDGTRDSAELGSEIKNDLKNYFYKRGGTIHPKDIPEVSGPNTEVDPAGWGYLDLYKLAKDQQKRFQKDFINQERKQLEQELSSKLAAREKAAGLNFQLPEEVALQQKELSKYARKFEKNKSDINKGFINLFESAKNYTPIVEEVAPPSKMGSYVDEFIANKQPVNELTTPKGWEQIGDSPVTKALDENGWPIDQYSEYLKRIGAADKSSITGPKILTKAQRDAFNKWKGKK
jgi:urease gamma subunit